MGLLVINTVLDAKPVTFKKGDAAALADMLHKGHDTTASGINLKTGELSHNNQTLTEVWCTKKGICLIKHTSVNPDTWTTQSLTFAPFAG